jgi:hypothetical protein
MSTESEAQVTWTWHRAPAEGLGFLSGSVYAYPERDETGQPTLCYIIKPHISKGLGRNGGRNGYDLYKTYPLGVLTPGGGFPPRHLGTTTSLKDAKNRAYMNHSPEQYGLIALPD